MKEEGVPSRISSGLLTTWPHILNLVPQSATTCIDCIWKLPTTATKSPFGFNLHEPQPGSFIALPSMGHSLVSQSFLDMPCLVFDSSCFGSTLTCILQASSCNGWVCVVPLNPFVRLSPDAPRQASMCINALKTECTGYSYVDRQINKWIVHIKQPYKCNDAWRKKV